MDISIEEKIQKIIDSFKKKGCVVVAFSGGVDSSVLLALSYKAIGNKAIGVTANSQTLALDELESAKKVAKEIGVKHIIVSYDELNEPNFSDNPVDRCYFCKKGLLRELKKVAKDCVVVEGTNISELSGHRPGYKAVLEEGVYTPFVEFNVTKDEIRQIAKILGLSVYDKPSMACLSSRFPYGQKITEEGLKRVGKAEKYLYSLGFKIVRVRCHSEIARIEVNPLDMENILKYREEICSEFKKLGFLYVTLDIMGFRSGSMDEIIKK